MTDRRRIAAVLLSLGLVTASCGSGDATTTPPTLATTAPATTAPAAESAPDSTAAADDAMDDGAVDDSAVDGDATEQSEEAAEPEAPAESEEPAEAVVNLFPDLDVQNISDGSTINLASTLGGGTTATLLWFFAPH